MKVNLNGFDYDISENYVTVKSEHLKNELEAFHRNDEMLRKLNNDLALQVEKLTSKLIPNDGYKRNDQRRGNL